MNPRAEQMRIRYRYRDLLRRGAIRLPPEAAARLIGPDCCYHLYAFLRSDGSLARERTEDCRSPPLPPGSRPKT